MNNVRDFVWSPCPIFSDKSYVLNILFSSFQNMYSIIIKESDIGIFDDYDVIPSKWILSKSTCMYPPNLLKYRAKRNADVQDFWTQMNIKIITDGHSEYLKNVFAFSRKNRISNSQYVKQKLR